MRLRAPGHPGKGHRRCPGSTLILVPRGGQSPGQRPPRPWRALASVGPGPAGLQGTVPRGRGNAMRFLFPPERAFPRMPGHSGRGHRPCHSATLVLAQPGAQSPRPAPAPPPAGASRPPGRALASVSPGPAGLQSTVAQGRGKRGSRLRVPPGGARSLPGTQRTSRPASGKIAVSVSGQSETGSRAASGVGSGAASAMATIAARSGSTDRSAS